jgi:hypothetical protein
MKIIYRFLVNCIRKIQGRIELGSCCPIGYYESAKCPHSLYEQILFKKYTNYYHKLKWSGVYQDKEGKILPYQKDLR